MSPLVFVGQNIIIFFCWRANMISVKGLRRRFVSIVEVDGISF